MARKTFKKGNQPRFTQLYDWFQKSEAWRSLKPGPRALYLELKQRFNGNNNGEIYLSHRQAAEAINVGRDTVGTYFQTLIDRGFIVVTRGHCLGPSGIGQSATYALTEARIGNATASKGFMRWKPAKKNR